ncbi:MAG: DUF3857 domain-containing protein [Elusimicrobiaceae bacterium]|nr:DUF3857 domain-containing protein [Elusimicrobiaceae bacterium]
MKIPHTLTILLFAACATARADILVLRDGTETEGAFAGLENKTLYFTDGRGVTGAIAEKDALKVLFVQRRENVPDYPAGPEAEAAAQSSATARDFDNEAAANWLRHYSYTLLPDGRAVRSRRVIRKLLLEEGRDAVGNAKFFYNSAYEEAGLQYALSLNGTTAAFTDATTVVDGTEETDFPEYDQYASVKFSIPRVSPGSAADYTVISTAPAISPQFPFFDRVHLLDRYPAKQLRIDVTVPDNIILLSSASAGVELVKTGVTESNGLRTETWTARNTPAKVRAAKYMPVFCFAQADSWENIASYFAGRIGELLKNDTLPELPPAAGLTETQRAAALYQLVSDNIIFAPVYMSHSTYLPRPASLTLKRGTGNMLDKPFALYALLLKNGIKASLVYSDTREDPAFFPEIPSIRQTAEAVILAELDGKSVWLAPLGQDNSFAALPPRLQDCTGLIVHGPGTGTLVKTPLAPPDESALRTVSAMIMDGAGNLRVKSRYSFTGKYDADWRQYRHITRDERRKNVEANLNAALPGVRLSSFEFTGLDSLSDRLGLRAEYELDGYALTAGGRYLAFRVPDMEKSSQNAVLETRDTELDLQSLDRTTVSAEIACPREFFVYHLPPPLSIDEECCGYSARYEKTPGGIRLDEEMTIKQPRIPAGQYPRYRDFIRKVSEYSRNYVVLKRKNIAQ